MSQLQGKPRVLIVEDDYASHYALNHWLTRLGFLTESAISVPQALELIDTWKPTAVILDLNLPEQNGLDLLRQIRRDQLPMRVAVMTGVQDAALLAEAQSLRPDAFFRKPWEISDITRWLEQ